MRPHPIKLTRDPNLPKDRWTFRYATAPEIRQLWQDNPCGSASDSAFLSPVQRRGCIWGVATNWYREFDSDRTQVTSSSAGGSLNAFCDEFTERPATGKSVLLAVHRDRDHTAWEKVRTSLYEIEERVLQMYQSCFCRARVPPTFEMKDFLTFNALQEWLTCVAASMEAIAYDLTPGADTREKWERRFRAHCSTFVALANYIAHGAAQGHNSSFPIKKANLRSMPMLSGQMLRPGQSRSACMLPGPRCTRSRCESTRLGLLRSKATWTSSARSTILLACTDGGRSCLRSEATARFSICAVTTIKYMDPGVTLRRTPHCHLLRQQRQPRRPHLHQHRCGPYPLQRGMHLRHRLRHRLPERKAPQ